MSKLQEVKKNHTFKFLFPMMYDEGITDDTFLKNEFDGIYLTSREGKTDMVLIYKPSNTLSFNELDKTLVKLKHFDTDKDLDNGKIAYIYNIPKRYMKEIDAFKEGKYSEFSDSYKDQVLKFWGLSKGDDPLYGILEKTDIAKENFDKFAKKYKDNTAEGEYYPKPNMDEEYIEV